MGVGKESFFPGHSVRCWRLPASLWARCLGPFGRDQRKSPPIFTGMHPLIPPRSWHDGIGAETPTTPARWDRARSRHPGPAGRCPRPTASPDGEAARRELNPRGNQLEFAGVYGVRVRAVFGPRRPRVPPLSASFLALREGVLAQGNLGERGGRLGSMVCCSWLCVPVWRCFRALPVVAAWCFDMAAEAS